MVKDHVKNVMGPAAAAYANTMLKMSKLQAAQVRTFRPGFAGCTAVPHARLAQRHRQQNNHCVNRT